MRVLVAEDEPRLGAFLEEALGEAGWEVERCDTGPGALSAARAGTHDVLLLDWVLPGLTGPEVVRQLRDDGSSLPVLLLTARGDVRDKVEGLDAGADDHLAKPFDLDELLARLRALRRRHVGHVAVHRAGDLAVDATARTVRRGDQEVALSPREFEILLLLARNAGRVVSRLEILERVWGGEVDLRSNAIDVHVAALRAKLDRPFARHAISTCRGAGFRLEADGG